jgi:hypothetical protein
MKILTNRNDVIIDIAKEIVYAKPGAPDGGYQICEEHDATHYWNREKDVVYMKNTEIQLYEVSVIPPDVAPRTHKFANNEFSVNENYTPYIPDRERIEALEDMINILLGV